MYGNIFMDEMIVKWISVTEIFYTFFITDLSCGFQHVSGFNPSLMSTPFPGMDHSMAMPQATTLGPSLGTGMGQTEVQYSGKHQGLCLYLARILRWVAACGFNALL